MAEGAQIQARRAAVGPVEIRSYEGDGQDLGDLVTGTWAQTYTGKMWYPVWDRDYFAWRLLDPRIREPDFLLCAYQGDRLVGCLLAEPLDLQVGQRPIRGSLSSWLSVDPAARNPTIGLRLFEALRRRHEALGMGISIGCTSLDPQLPNRRFWMAMTRREPESFRHLRPMYFWTRIFDRGAVADAGLSAFDKVGSTVAGFLPWGKARWREGAGLRDWEPDDLPRCLSWLKAQAQGADIHIRWTPKRLEHQLNSPPYAKTLIIDDGPERGAFINYYTIQFAGAQQVKTGVIDLFAGDASLGRQIDLLKAACQQMIDDGVQMAVMMASAAAPKSAMLGAGFLPNSAHQELFCIFPDPELEIPPSPSLHILFS